MKVSGRITMLMAGVSSSTPMVTLTKECGVDLKQMEKELTRLFKEAALTLDSGAKITRKAMELRSGTMVLLSMASLTKARNTALELKSGVMALFTKANGATI